jgi:hypothetical protein
MVPTLSIEITPRDDIPLRYFLYTCGLLGIVDTEFDSYVYLRTPMYLRQPYMLPKLSDFRR